MGLGAWCDYGTDTLTASRDRGSTDRPSGWSPIPGGRAAPATGSGQALHFRVEEFATLSDGVRLTLSEDRGWTTSIHTVQAGLPPDPWAHLSVEAIVNDVHNVLLPDDAEESGDEHPWAVLTARIRAFGVETSPEQLRELPYVVILSARLRARVSAPD